MKREIIQTSDGSKSLFLPEYDETYHSRHGAVQEAYHVFIRNGLDLFEDARAVRVLEMGFGTGLNCFITWLEATRRNLEIRYYGLEAYPISADLAGELGYPLALGHPESQPVFEELHSCPWNSPVMVREGFELQKVKGLFSDFDKTASFDLVYFDAFGPRVQPELWTAAIFEKMHRALDQFGVLVTYSAKGSVRRALQSVGFEVERLPGPPGKREMLRAIKGGESL